MRKKIIIIITVVLSLIVYAGYMSNKHMKTITDYSNNGISKNIWVSDLSRIKTIPNYAKEEGFELVFKSDYDKYQKGYCLKENKIFTDEELFRRGIVQYLEKSLDIDKKISTYRFNCCYGEHEHLKPVGFYGLSGLNSTDWYEKLKENFDVTKESGLRDMLFKTFDAKSVEISKLLTLDMNTMTGRFKEPVVQCNGLGNYSLYLDNTLFLNKDDDGLCFNLLRVDYLIPEREMYIGDKLRYESLKREKINVPPFKIDHCGNVNYSVEKMYLKYR